MYKECKFEQYCIAHGQSQSSDYTGLSISLAEEVQETLEISLSASLTISVQMQYTEEPYLVHNHHLHQNSTRMLHVRNISLSNFPHFLHTTRSTFMFHLFHNQTIKSRIMYTSNQRQMAVCDQSLKSQMSSNVIPM